MSPDERAFQEDVVKATFRLGEADRRWHLLDVTWPWVLVGVFAKDGREYVLRFNCLDYPQSPPTGGPWDPERACVLAFNLWPRSRGGRLGSVFRTDWKNGTALYLPCDRESLPGHDNWRT